GGGRVGGGGWELREDGHHSSDGLGHALTCKEREGSTDRYPQHRHLPSGEVSDALQQRDRLVKVGLEAEPTEMWGVESRAAAVPVEDAEVVFQKQELAVPPALVQERQSGGRLNDKERRQALGGRLAPDGLIPGNAWHPDLLKWRRSAGGSGGHAPLNEGHGRGVALRTGVANQPGA